MDNDTQLRIDMLRMQAMNARAQGLSTAGIEKQLTLLYKQADNVKRKVEKLDYSVSRTEPTISSKNSNSGIRYIAGGALATPQVVARKRHKPLDNALCETVFYALSVAGEYPFYARNFLFDGIGNVYVNGQLITNIQPIDFITNSILYQNWRVGSNGTNQPYPPLGGAIQGSPLGGGPAGELNYNNFYISYIKAGEYIPDTAFYKAFGPESPNPFFRNAINAGDLPDNTNFDMLAVFYRYDTRYFDSYDPLLQCEYYRYPVVPEDATQNDRVIATSGNAILEIISNKNWGMGLDLDKYVLTDFLDVGPSIGVNFNLDNTSLTEIIEIFNAEYPDFNVFDQQGVLRYANTNATATAITDDNIIGEIEIQYPDQKDLPTQLIATYTSYERGTSEIVVGNDPTNIIRINLQTVSDFDTASAIAQNIFRDLQGVLTISFKADKSFQQFTLFDTLTLSTPYFSATIKIISMTLNNDYTYDVVAEAIAGTEVPNARLGSARPVIPINRNYYRPKAQERPFTPQDDPDDDPTPVVPAEPPQPAPNLRIIPNLNHPYNFVTGTENTNWYLGSTQDGTTNDQLYDSNGCRTRFRLGGGGAVYKTDFSLIFRPIDLEPPRGIIVAYDVHADTSEQNLNLVGKNGFRYAARYQFPGFFSDENNNMLVYDSRGSNWRIFNLGWWNWQNLFIISGGGLDEFAPNDNPNNFVFQYGDIEGFHADRRYFHTLDELNTYYPSNLNATCGFRNQRRSGAYRVHFSAFYGNDIRNPYKVEYIGSTSTYGDNISVLPADVPEARAVAGEFGLPWTATYTNPPSRSIT